MRLLSAISFASLLSATQALHVLVYLTASGKSHLNVANSLVDTLHKHGHTVDFLAPRLNPGLDVKIPNANRTWIIDNDYSEWKNAMKHVYSPFEKSTSSLLGQLFEFQSTFGPYANQIYTVCEKVLESPLLAEISSVKYDFALVSNYDYCSPGIVHILGIRRFSFYGALPTIALSVIHGGFPELPLYHNNAVERRSQFPKSSLLGRTMDLVQSYAIRIIYSGYRQRYNSLFRQYKGHDFPDVGGIARNASFDYSLRHPLIDIPRVTAHKIKHIGGMAMKRPGKLPEHLDSLLNQRKGTVLFSFGTMIPAVLIPEHVIQAFLQAFRMFPDYTFLWKLEGRQFPDVPNVVTTDWLPQTDLLYDSRVIAFISHMGSSSFTEVAYAGTPVVALPLQIDQFYNADCAIALGIGVRLDKTDLIVGTIKRALEEVLGDESYSKRSAELARMMADYPETPERTFIESVEFAAAHNGLYEHLTPVGSEYSLIVQNGHDAVMLLLVLLISVLALVLALIAIVIRSVKSVKEKVE